MMPFIHSDNNLNLFFLSDLDDEFTEHSQNKYQWPLDHTKNQIHLFFEFGPYTNCLTLNMVKFSFLT